MDDEKPSRTLFAKCAMEFTECSRPEDDPTRC
jgi:hypothetical protein